MHRLVSVLGLVVMIALAWLLSDQRRKMNVCLILSGLAMQFVLAVLVLRTKIGLFVFDMARTLVTQLLSFSAKGAEFVFGTELAVGTESKVAIFAFSVLPTVVFVSSLTAVLFHLGVLQKVVGFMAKIMVWVV